MKKSALFLFAICLYTTSCTKTKSCTCKDPSGKIVYNEVNKTRSKQESNTFQSKCLEKESTYYTIGSGSVATTQTTVPCEIS
jgi:hypothetical protein